MYPTLGPVPTYMVLYMAGIAVQGWLAWRGRRRFGLSRRFALGLGIAYFLAMIVGAKALWNLRAGSFSLSQVLDPENYTRGGLWGGLLVYVPLAALLALLSPRRREGLDLMVLVLPVPLILSKAGCFCAGCCYGQPGSLPWAVTFTAQNSLAPTGVARHPTQLYEVLLLLVILVAFRLLDRDRWRGLHALWFFAIYGIGRPITELWRGDLAPRFLGILSFSQVACIVAAGASVLLLLRLAPPPRRLLE